MYEFVLCALILVSFLSLLAIGTFFMENPYHGKSRVSHYPTIDQIKDLNKQYAAARAKKEIEVERGKLLKFERQPYYLSTKNKK